MIEASRGCQSCGKLWVKHDGVRWTCHELQLAKERIAELEKMVDAQAERIAQQSELLAKKAEKRRAKK